jgi:hypothetical protein
MQMTNENPGPDARVTTARIRARTVRDAPWIGILALTSGFQFFRGAQADGLWFAAAAAALALDLTGARRFARTPRLPPRVVAFSVGVVIVALLTLLPRYSFADGVIVVGIGLSVIPFAWPNPVDAPAAAPAVADAPSRAIRRAAILWSILAVALCMWELGSFLLGMPSPSAEYAHPPLSDLIGPLLDDPFWRTVGVTLWVLGGAALLRRGRRP